MAASSSDEDAVYCICKEMYDATKFMIQCDVCKDWFHGKCVEIQEYQAADIENYHCPNCQLTHGPLVLKQRRNCHRHDYSEDDTNSSKAVQSGTIMFIKDLKTRAFCGCEEIPIIHLTGAAVTIEYLIANSFTKPIIVDKKDGLGLTVPPSNFSVNDVEGYVGSVKEVDVIDVSRQEDYKMLMREWTEYYNSPNRKKIYNVISLEFSKTGLTELVIPPKLVRQLSWANNSWPSELPHDCSYTKPAVQKYCLMGVKDSYTDFHVDFGGSSVWYHILRGEKVFYLIPPTSCNLALYEHWISSPNQSETFFGDQVERCHKCVLKQGQTIFLPSGWIHAVFTPIDSLVFGGNFLHDFNIEMQIQIYEIERRVKTVEKFMFPCFETSHWYKAKIILDYIKDCNVTEKLPHRHMLEGGKAIAAALKSWTKRKDFVRTAKYDVPEHIIYNKLLRDLNKELKLYDAVSPESSPKRSKRSKKKGRKTSAEDFDALTNLKEETERKIMEIEKHRGRLKGKKKHNKKDSKTSLKVRLPNLRTFRSSSASETTSSPEKKTRLSPRDPPKTRLKLKVSNGKIVSPTISDTSLSPEKSTPPKAIKAKTSKSHTNKRDKNTTKSGKTRLKRENSENIVVDVKNENSENIGVKNENSENVIDVKDENLPVNDIDDERENKILVDESLKKINKVKRVPRSSPVKSGSLKLRLSFHGRKIGSDISNSENTTSDEISQESSTDSRRTISPKKPHHKLSERKNTSVIRGGLNGSISDILEASGYGTESDIKIDPENEYVASPGTREAIQGMLSMRNSSTTLHTTPAAQDVYDFDEEEQKLQSCYKDEEYFYPSLEMSDEESEAASLSRLRDTEDSNWNPRASINVSQTIPRDKLPRDGAKRESVGNTLALTAVKLHDNIDGSMVKKKRPYTKRKKKPEKPKDPPPLEFLSMEPLPGTSSMIPPSSEELEAHLKRHLSSPPSPSKAKRPKKGFATAKQRLGKILKIHKMSF